MDEKDDLFDKEYIIALTQLCEAQLKRIRELEDRAIRLQKQLNLFHEELKKYVKEEIDVCGNN